MRILIYGTLALSIFFTVAVTAVVVSNRTEAEHTVYAPINPELLPGNPMPPGSACYSQLQDGDKSYCQVFQNPRDTVWFTYDRREKRIVHSNTLVDRAIGDLVLIWGTPVGIDQLGYGVNVFWPDHYVFLKSGSFGPSSRITFVAYYTEKLNYHPWKGFVNGPDVDQGS